MRYYKATQHMWSQTAMLKWLYSMWVQEGDSVPLVGGKAGLANDLLLQMLQRQNLNKATKSSGTNRIATSTSLQIKDQTELQDFVCSTLMACVLHSTNGLSMW